jgi:hypothetical protein
MKESIKIILMSLPICLGMFAGITGAINGIYGHYSKDWMCGICIGGFLVMGIGFFWIGESGSKSDK